MDSLTSYFYMSLRKTYLVTLFLSTVLLLFVYKHTVFPNSRLGTPANKIELSNPECLNETLNPEVKRQIYTNKVTDDELNIALKNLSIKHGGCWSPTDCTPTTHLAIIIPFRNREEHLNVFLLNMHPFFAKQKLDYCIYLIEPVAEIQFNRGLLLNIGFVEANVQSESKWNCHSFHDIDMIAESEHTSYRCPDHPTHLTDKINKWGYRLPYGGYFGGATIMRKEHYIKANGYSNVYFGWGAEDDDHLYRIQHAGLKVIRPSGDSPIGRYYTLSHSPDAPNENRVNLLNQARSRFATDGLNSLEYKIINVLKTNFYTKIYVYYNKTKIVESKKP